MEREDIKALLTNKRKMTLAMFLDGRQCRFEYHATSTIQDAIENIAQAIHLVNYQTFALYEIKKSESVVNGELVDEYKHLEENLYVADVLSRRDDKQDPAFLFKKRMFR